MSSHTQRVVDVNPTVWSTGEPKTVVYNNADSLTIRQLGLFFRVDERFKARQFSLDIDIISPLGDTVNYGGFTLLCDSARVSYPSAEMVDYAVSYIDSLTLEHKGDYLINFKPQHPIKGVWAMGINIGK